MIVFIMNGSNQTGKDTFVDVFSKCWEPIYENIVGPIPKSLGRTHEDSCEIPMECKPVIHISTVDPYKNLFMKDIRHFGVTHYFRKEINDKTETYRLLLSKLKDLFDTEYKKNHGICLSTQYVIDRIEHYAANNPMGICFVDCRESVKVDELKSALTKLNHNVYIVKTIRFAADTANNPSDKDATENQEYDILVNNNLHITESVTAFLYNHAFPIFSAIYRDCRGNFCNE